MKKDTTVYINSMNLEKLDDAFIKTKLKRNDIIIKLLEFAIRENKNLQNDRTSVEYQKSIPNARWKTIHVSLPEDIVVFCLDMRRFYCKSVSLILACSVVNFLKDLINNLLGIGLENSNSDNYQLDDIRFSREVFENGICWSKTWKLPPST